MYDFQKKLDVIENPTVCGKKTKLLYAEVKY